MKHDHVSFNIPIDIDEIAYELGRNLSHDEIRDFIMLIDEEASDWDFSVSIVNKLLRSLGSDFIIVADEQKKDGSVTIQIDKREISNVSFRKSTGVVEFIHD